MALEKILNYFKNVRNLLNNLNDKENTDESNSFEQREIILKNAFAEIDGYEYRLCCHHDGSLLVEELLGTATNIQLRIFLNRLVSSFVKLISNRYASHVIETALVTLISNYSFVESEDRNDLVPGSKEIIKIFIAEVNSDLENLVYDTFASKVLRKVVPLLAKDPSKSLSDAVNIFVNSMKELDLESLAKDSCGSLVLQDFITAGIQFDYKDLFNLSFDKNASRVVEVVITNSNEDTFDHIWKRNFKGKLKELLLVENNEIGNKSSNFVLQKLISACKSVKTLKNIIEELKTETENLLKFPGIILRLCEKSISSSEFDAVQKILKKDILDNLFPGFDVLRLLTLNSVQTDKLITKPLGCQIVSCLLSFKREETSLQIVKQLKDLPSEIFLKLVCDKYASRVFEKYFSSISVQGNEGECTHSIPKFVKKIEGKISLLACDPNGSHLLEQIFDLSKSSHKLAIASELVPKKKILEDSKYGYIVWNKLRLEEFIHNRERWINYGEHLQKRKSLFDDILNDDTQQKDKKSRINKS